MRRFLPALVLILIALALTLSVGRPASAMPREQGVVQVVMAFCDADPDGSCNHEGCHDGKCIHACCSTGAAAAFPVLVANLRRVALYATLDLPADSRRDGITVRPFTGPPKLSI